MFLLQQTGTWFDMQVEWNDVFFSMSPLDARVFKGH